MQNASGGKREVSINNKLCKAAKWPQRGKGKTMAKPKAVTPNVLIKAWVHPELKAKMALLLVSEVEGRIPLGKISSFISERIREYFDWAKLDLGLYGFGQGYFVSGPKPMIEALEARLKGGGNAVS